MYNEQIKDLLADGSNARLRLREDRVKGFYVEGVTNRVVKSVDDLISCLEQGEKRRHVGCTNMNEKSSRSHTIFTVNVESRHRAGKAPDLDLDLDAELELDGQDDPKDEHSFGVLVGKLAFVDLAGSENARNTGASGDRLKEGANINKSLMTLSRVISQLAKRASKGGRATYVNFRDSKLTQILQPSIAGNCRTAVICCVTSAPMFTEETKSTLNFASRAKQIKTVAVVNEVLENEEEMKKLKFTIQQLRSELATNGSAKEVVAVEEKEALERKIDRLSKLVMRGFGEDLFFAKRSQEKKRRKKMRETWCPGDASKSLLPPSADAKRSLVLGSAGLLASPMKPGLPRHDGQHEIRILSLQRKRDDLLGDLNAKKNLLADQTACLEQLFTKCDSYRKSMKKKEALLNSLAVKQKELQEENNDAQVQLKGVEEARSSLQEQLRQAQNAMDDMRQKYDESVAELEEKSQEVTDLQLQHKEQDRLNAALQTRNSEMAAMAASLKELEQEKENAEKELGQQKDKAAKLEKDQEKMVAKNAEMHAENARLADEKANVEAQMQQKIEAGKAKMAEIESLGKEVSRLADALSKEKAKNESEVAKVADRQANVNSLREKLSQANVEATKQAEEIIELRRVIEDAKGRAIDAKAEHDAAIESLEQKLKTSALASEDAQSASEAEVMELKSKIAALEKQVRMEMKTSSELSKELASEKEQRTSIDLLMVKSEVEMTSLQEKHFETCSLLESAQTQIRDLSSEKESTQRLHEHAVQELTSQGDLVSRSLEALEAKHRADSRAFENAMLMASEEIAARKLLRRGDSELHASELGALQSTADRAEAGRLCAKESLEAALHSLARQRMETEHFRTKLENSLTNASELNFQLVQKKCELKESQVRAELSEKTIASLRSDLVGAVAERVAAIAIAETESRRIADELKTVRQAQEAQAVAFESSKVLSTHALERCEMRCSDAESEVRRLSEALECKQAMLSAAAANEQLFVESINDLLVASCVDEASTLGDCGNAPNEIASSNEVDIKARIEKLNRDWRQRLEEARNIISSKESEKQQAKEEAALLEEKVERLELSKKSLEADLVSAAEQRTAMEATLESFHIKACEQENEVRTLEKSVADAKLELVAAQSSRKEADASEIAALHSQLRSLEEQCAIAQGKYATAKEEADQRREKGAALERDVEEAQGLCRCLKAELDANIQVINETTAALEAEKAENEALQNAGAAAEEAISKLHDDASKAANALDVSKAKGDALQSRVAELSSEVKALEESANEKKHALLEAQKAADATGKLKAACANHAAELKVKDARIAKLEKTKLTREDIEKIRTMKLENGRMRKELIQIKAKLRLDSPKRRSQKAEGGERAAAAKPRRSKRLNKENSDPQVVETIVFDAPTSSSTTGSGDVLDNPPECAQQ